jgi:hypothetical protein
LFRLANITCLSVIASFFQKFFLLGTGGSRNYRKILVSPLRNAVLPQLFDPVKPGGAEAPRLT